jgi:predicted outer membrane protein
MTKWIAMAALMVMTAACSSEKKTTTAKPFDANRFVLEALQITRSNSELGGVAAKRAWAPITRQLGATMRADQERLHREFAALAAKRGIVAPEPLMQRHLALRENLAQLPGQVFDRGYTLAMVQELQKLQRDAERAKKLNDGELSQLAASVQPRLAALEKQAQTVLDRNGGSPFEF